MTALIRPGAAFLAVLLLVFCPAADSRSGESPWRALDEGLALALFRELPASPYLLVVLKVDPRYYELTLLSSSEEGKKAMSLRDWCAVFGLDGAINASMYLEDGRRSTGFMKNYDHVNNATINARFGAFLVFNPRDGDLPPVQIVDREHQDWQDLISRYETVVQNYRLITLEGRNAWRSRSAERRFSAAAIAMDGEGQVLFIFSRQPRDVHELAEHLLALPLNIRNAMYVEGGQDAGLFIADLPEDMPDRATLSFLEGDEGYALPLVPNVIGIRKIRR